jgi:hypothetical protein
MSTPTLRLVRCKSPACEQVLARVGERGDVYPVVVGAYVDKEGRLTIHCPLCTMRNRLPVRRTV